MPEKQDPWDTHVSDEVQFIKNLEKLPIQTLKREIKRAWEEVLDGFLMMQAKPKNQLDSEDGDTLYQTFTFACLDLGRLMMILWRRGETWTPEGNTEQPTTNL
jgi:hypothetical protein